MKPTKGWSAKFSSTTNKNEGTISGIRPDVAEAFMAALRNLEDAPRPRHEKSFEELTATIAQTSHLIQFLERFRERAIVAADRTSYEADRKAIAIAAGIPPSRLYRILEQNGRPKDRRQFYMDTYMEGMERGLSSDDAFDAANRRLREA
ncbi:hypothetical protein [Streptomyces sp. NPDC017941]|uniref:hypothetical protein n=1 Tax=Streptomyces sp. NPDC017941 TaxID=3365018 RepID=UPI00379513AC